MLGRWLRHMQPFSAEGSWRVYLYVENTTDLRKEWGQAVALLSYSDQLMLYHYTLSNFQDTFYAEAERQFYRECRISGTWQSLLPHLPIQGQQNTVTAEGQEKPTTISGFYLQSCNAEADNDT